MTRPKKLLNDPLRVVEESLEGLVFASDGEMRLLPGYTIALRSSLRDDKVALLIGGGSGHEPIFAGYVGKGLADGAVCGQMFAAPTPDAILEATRAVNKGKGVLYIYGNYSGDNMNFDIAAELAEEEGITTKTVRVRDDVAAAPIERIDDRRGIAGDVFVIKVAGAAAEVCDSLDELYRIAAKAEANTHSIGVAVAAGSIPETGEATFEIGDDEIEIGMGAHGEPGTRRQKIAPADAVVDEMMDMLLADMGLAAGDEVALLIDNLGSSTAMELYIANRRVRQRLAQAGVQVHLTEVGPFMTSQEMAGFSITMMRLDEELKRFIDAPARSAAYTR
ncbi:dihydroxyacetone kinase subunit DhaK [Rhodospirillum rubrum]|uniref:dihydroxyacetone kinase subunit DhaK n=1 Tax=Rhodospirillum rubrum TaxID=1085 RepID=UPI0028AF9F1C|nr:dihydroxyacetone kinase subunit DhaK [Rhodospirillum rubrum]